MLRTLSATSADSKVTAKALITYLKTAPYRYSETAIRSAIARLIKAKFFEYDKYKCDWGQYIVTDAGWEAAGAKETQPQEEKAAPEDEESEAASDDS